MVAGGRRVVVVMLFVRDRILFVADYDSSPMGVGLVVVSIFRMG